ncbi:MAG: ABC transporter permease [Oscillospiraceae bacterium]|nr:ABC transporter permease [Oscillospiraceae bacterium]MCD7934852.1 ABC transporter permease [Oscillospiraceae bacterium]MCD8001336.1 ABC transporter permease [Oscillospiraceae bacterium]
MAKTDGSTVVLREPLPDNRTWRDGTLGTVICQFTRNKTALVGLIIILVLVLMAIFAPLLAPYDYAVIDPINANQSPSAEHWFGTDAYGRDILSRIIYGARYSLSLGVLASLFGTCVGVIFGAIAGYCGGQVENLILRICDIIQSIPNTLLCIVVSVTLGNGFLPTIIALSLYSIPEVVRILRANLLSLREQEFVEACRAINCSNLRILVSHLLPNSLSPLIVSFSLGIGMKIMSSAGLSFLGLGIQEPIAEWGAMIAGGRAQLRYAPHVLIFPGIFVALTVMAFNIVGDGMRDALDPKLRR